MMNDTCGPTSGTPLAQYDPDEQCWKTSVAISLWALTMSSLTLPPWGCLHDGELYELPTPERPTIEPGFSSLPTPKARDYKDESLPPRITKLDWQGGAQLPRVIALLPTAGAQNGEPRNQTIYKREGPQNLENALALLPTPKSAHGGPEATTTRPSGSKGSTNLHGALMHQPSTAGSTSSDAQHQAPLFSEQDETA